MSLPASGQRWKCDRVGVLSEAHVDEQVDTLDTVLGTL